MTITRKTFERKTGGKWTVESIIDSNVANILLNDDMISKYLFKSPEIKSIKYGYGKIIVNYSSVYRAIYD